MIHWYCTCVASDKRKSDTKKDVTALRKVKADKGDICEDCGHYAIASKFELVQPKELAKGNRRYQILTSKRRTNEKSKESNN